MPIKGLTDRPASFPEIGSIRKGAPKPEDGKRPGADLQYFRVEFDERETQALQDFRRVYRDHPKEINILFPFSDIERNFDAWREAYVASALIHRCDGERVWYEINPKTGERLVLNGDPFKVCDGRLKCRPTGRMKVLIPELKRLAYLVVHTTSVHDIANLSRQLEALHAINGGRLAGIPLILRRRPVKISTPSGENGERARREKWLLSVEADPAWVAAKIKALNNDALPGSALPALEAPEIIESNDEEHLDEPEGAPLPIQTAPEHLPTGQAGENPKPALLKIKDAVAWQKLCKQLVAVHPRYSVHTKGKPSGVPEMHHILGAAGKCGFAEVTDANMESVIEAIAARAMKELAAEPAA